MLASPRALRSHRSAAARRLAALLLLLGAGAIAVALSGAAQWLRHPLPSGLPPFVAAGLFLLVFAVGTVLFVPKPVLGIAAGALFGIPEGIALAVAGTTLGAALAFTFGRRLGREAVRPWLRTRAWQAFDRRLTTQGFRSVLALRLLPVVPFAAVNYGAAFAGTPFRGFLAATAVGVVPGSVAAVVAGATASSPSPTAVWIGVAALLVLAGQGMAPRVLACVRRKRRAGMRPGGGKLAVPELANRPTSY